MHGHILGLVDVLDGDRQSIQLGKRAPVLVPRGRSVGRLARALEIERDERLQLGLARIDGLDAALEIGAW